MNKNILDDIANLNTNLIDETSNRMSTLCFLFGAGGVFLIILSQVYSKLNQNSLRQSISLSLKTYVNRCQTLNDLMVQALKINDREIEFQINQKTFFENLNRKVEILNKFFFVIRSFVSFFFLLG